MMKDYEFEETEMSLAAEATVQPSEQVLQNIINFARSYQTIDVEGVRLKLFLN